MKITSETINFGDKLQVFQDKKTKVHTVAIPVEFPSGFNAIISITRLSPQPWTPSEEIDSLTINYKTNDE